ncbi:MAG: agmatinase [Bdellovibrionaceae bacterium]|nr:agmatinase [Pseudobdellovibrionaceae bacterium]
MSSYSEITKRSYPRFSGVHTFFRLRYQKPEKVKSHVLLCGIPFDGGTTYRTGARMAPSRVREISALGRGYHPQWNQDVFETLKPVDVGDIPTNPISIKKTYELIEKHIFDLAEKDKKKILSVGGDHSITLPILRALSKIHGPLNLIHFDAHFDTYPQAYGMEYHHGTFVRHAVLEKCVNKVFQFGIRGPYVVKEDMDFCKKHKIQVFTVDDIKNKGLKVLSELPELIKGPCYLSFDVDCLDPAYAPGTGTPVVGGLNSYEVQRILRNLKIENLIGGDVVEVNPSYDHGDITSLVAVSVLFEVLNLMV